MWRKSLPRQSLNAQNAQTTDELARSIQKDAEAGNEQMAEMLRAMDVLTLLQTASCKIIKVIEEYRLPDKYLALNAAVESGQSRAIRQGLRRRSRGSQEILPASPPKRPRKQPF